MTCCLRAILHLDLDCYYAQVEAKTRGIPPDEPLAVQQWGGLLAVNYAARSKGVKRGMRVDEATRLCPRLHTPHVPVIGDELAASSSNTQPDRVHAKVSLDKYRQESQQIFALLERLAPSIERVSIDEAYVDVTDLAAAELVAQRAAAHWAETSTECVQSGSDSRWHADANDPMDSLLLGAARVCRRLRAAVRDELGYAISAGIAHSKMVAKLASAKNKPDQQTLIPRTAVPLVMATMPLRDVRGLGGRLGEHVASQLGIHMAGELRAVTRETLTRHFGDETARWLAAVADGGEDDEVRANLEAKSLNAIKSFAATRDDATIRRWVHLLAAELVERMASDREMNARVPRKLKVQFRGALSSNHREKWVAGKLADLTPVRSRQCVLPGGGQRVATSAQVAAAALTLLRGDGSSGSSSVASSPWPTFTRIALCVSDFVPCAGPGVAAFFSKAPERAAAPTEAAEDTGAAAAPAAEEQTAAREEFESDASAVTEQKQEVSDVEQHHAGGAAAEEGDSWQCRRCTFLNSVLLPACEMCDERRAPTISSPARPGASKRYSDGSAARGAGNGGRAASGSAMNKKSKKRAAHGAASPRTAPADVGLEAFGFVKR